MNRRTSILLALVGVFTACSGDTNNNGDGGGDATTQDVVGTDGQQDTGPATDSGSDAADAAPVPCKGSDAGCNSCCAALHPDAAAIFVGDLATCACSNPGDCNTAATCKQNLCNGNPPTAGCGQCLTDKDAGNCFTTAAGACLGDPSCQPLVACVVACGSGGPPADAGAD